MEKDALVTSRGRLAQIDSVRATYEVVRTLRNQFGLGLRWIGGLFSLWSFGSEYRRFRRMNTGASFGLRGRDIRPCLLDRTSQTPIEPVYFVQDTWFAHRLSARRPARHVDVGSSAKTMALVAQFVPVTMIDIRPVPLSVPNYSFIKGSILALPFEDGTVESLSSLCVIEHIGLGRYGDEMDAWGSEKAWKEMLRVLKPGGDFYVSVPVDASNRVYFNAHRAFTRDYVMELSQGLNLVHEQYLYGTEIVPSFNPSRGFGTGMFHFKK